MSVLIWNAHGLGNRRAFRELHRLTADKSPSILFISETKLRSYSCTPFCRSLGFSGVFAVNSSGRSGGLVLCWSADCNIRVLSYSSGHIDCMVSFDDLVWCFTGFYGNPNAQLCSHSWTLLR